MGASMGALAIGALATGGSSGEQVIVSLPDALQTKECPRQSASQDVVKVFPWRLAIAISS